MLSFINQFEFLSEKETEALSQNFQEEHFKRGDFLIKEGQICHKIYFIKKGSARSFRFLFDKELTNWFAFRNEPITSYFSFITQSPSKESIQLLEDATLLSINFKSLQNLYERFHKIERIGRKIAEFYFIWQEERTMSLQCLTAKEKYSNLLSKEPLLLQKATLGQIASYIGITQESLSRIRKNS